MSRYTPVNGTSNHYRTPSDRPAPSGLPTSIFPPRSLNDNNGNSGGPTFPNSREMNAAFDMSDDEDEGEDRRDRRGLLSGTDHRRPLRSEQPFTLGADDSDEEEDSSETRPLNPPDSRAERAERFDDPLRTDVAAPPDNDRNTERMPGSYDFERDFFLTAAPPARPASPPPFFPYWSQNPAPENSNGIIPTTTPDYPRGHPSHHSTRLELIGALLPSFFGGRPRAAQGPTLGGGHTGVFANLSARPELPRAPPREGEAEGPEWVPEMEGKDVPPTYEAALRDAVPPYWETTVVLPSSSGPFGTMTSSMTGDEILIDGMPVGNFFIFAWNMLVSLSFQFVGFLLTYVLHTSHAAKHGSRAGLGITLIQYGLFLHTRAEEMITTNQFPHDDSDDPNVDPNVDPFESVETLKQYWRPGFRTPAHWSTDGSIEIPSFKSPEDAKAWELDHSNLNMTMAQILQEPTAAEVGQANEYLSFLLMAVGWFLFLTSIGGYWRVKRFENGLRTSQNPSDDPTAELGNEPVDPEASNPRRPAYYILRAGRAMNSVREAGRSLRGSLYYFNLPPLGRRRGRSDENSVRRGEDSAEAEGDGAEGYLLFDRSRERDVDMDDGADLPSAAARQGLTMEEWSRRNLYNG